jgi:hypothetical protein
MTIVSRPAPTRLLGSAAATYVVYRLLKAIIIPLLSPLRALPGPPSPNWIYGHFLQLMGSAQDVAVVYEGWNRQYGDTFITKGLFGVSITLFSFKICLVVLKQCLVHSIAHNGCQSNRTGTR